MDSQHTQTQTEDQKHKTRQAALAGLAVVGFIALIIVGITLAIYSARFIPSVVNKIGGAAATLSTSSSTPKLAVIRDTDDTLPIATSSPATQPLVHLSTVPAATDTDDDATAPAPAAQPKPKLYGLSDLAVTVTAVGFLAGDTTDTFVATPVIPAGAHPAIKFSVKNIGTNVSAPWMFSANIPSATGPYFNSQVEQPLGPGDHIDFTLGFNQTVPGNQIVSVIVDPSNSISEITKTNNTAVAGVVVQGQ